jgi:hypothetical protein
MKKSTKHIQMPIDIHQPGMAQNPVLSVAAVKLKNF